MKAILVDDESLALRDLERQLRKNAQVEIIGAYQEGKSALQAAFDEEPDVVFLDIDMPELSGIEVAELLQTRLPFINIVFVTSYEEFAVKAFELNAVDYILKPIIQERLSRTLERLISLTAATATKADDSQGIIRCFQYLQIDFDHPKAIQWRTTKAQELFAYLVHRRSHPVRKDVLIELLWPETDAQKGFTQLYTAIYQIRKTLRDLGLGARILSSDKGYRLELNGMKLDTDEWESSLQAAPSVTPDAIPYHLALLDQYRGDYLTDYDYLWAEGERERLRILWYQHAVQVGQILIDEGMLGEAVILYNRIQYLFPHVGEVYFVLMKLYDQCKDWTSVDRQYATLNKMINEEFETEPQPHIVNWYSNWKLSTVR
ncbi:response regulator [Paenibacillus sp. LMG 31456]|uniref:Response regulator n=1 Tax=Paenibacillus foliorum TaxID=2654974 RepID=A0A972GMR2_9BACL|nr:response regulator [Paenibacillus foliorum]NOU93537.1 response regulator [Paenibacillus foliorum]